MNYDDKEEVTIAHRVLRLAHYWEYFAKEGLRTTSIKCILCESPASAIFYCPRGCTCSVNKIQPRCEYHIMRANEEMYTLEDFRRPK